MSELGFGTAGLRAPMGEGPGQLNVGVIARVSAALAAYLQDLTGREDALVVVGHDARHRSAEFAADTAAVLRGAGLEVATLPPELPTPVLAFAVRHLRAAAGVMITASHNPATDNGYKVFLADGAQVAPPADAAVEAYLAAAPSAVDIPRAAGTRVAEGVLAAYLERAVGLLTPGGPRELRVVHTALHGVAAATFRRAWARAGFPTAAEVAAQAEPDPDFPTVAFPNPEEHGALDLAAARAREVGADLVLAHDPDGDRCAVMVPVPPERGGTRGFRALTGDEVGVLLAEHLLVTGRIPADGVLASTVVSSPQLARVAAAHGREHAETLTGFKWLARVARLAYAYEEALGYCADPAAVRDKDGITAALLVAELAALERAQGRTLLDRLDELARAHGLHVTAARSILTRDPDAATHALADLISDPPTQLGGHPVDAVEDLSLPADGLPPTPGVRMRAGPLRAIVRPSGTEPKLKIYLHAAIDTAPVDLAAARARASAVLAQVGDDLAARSARGRTSP